MGTGHVVRNGVTAAKQGWHGIAAILGIAATFLTLATVVFSSGKSQARLERVELTLKEVRVALGAVERDVGMVSVQQARGTSERAAMTQRINEMAHEIRENRP